MGANCTICQEEGSCLKTGDIHDWEPVVWWDKTTASFRIISEYREALRRELTLSTDERLDRIINDLNRVNDQLIRRMARLQDTPKVSTEQSAEKK